MPPAEAEAVPGDCLVQQRRLDEASKHLARAATLESTIALVSVVTAMFDVASDRFDEARKRLAAIGSSAGWLEAYLAGTTLAQLPSAREP